MVGRKVAIALAVLWILAVAYGLHSLMLYKGKPGLAGEAPKLWPRNELIIPSFEKPQLIMFAHPKCPCTKASLAELEVLAAKSRGKFEAAVVFYEPESEVKVWSETASIALAESIPGVRVVLDHNGVLARRFGAETSGHTVVYGTDRKLAFSGGITGSRGHFGDNAGLDAVIKLTGNDSASSSPTTVGVFGCPIFNDAPATRRREKTEFR